jgi:hypothetical protein
MSENAVDYGCLQISIICAAAVDILAKRNNDGDDLHFLMELIHQGEETDRELQKWHEADDPEWNFNTIDIVDIEGHSGRVDTYSSISNSFIWNIYRGARILLYETLADCVKRCSHLGYLDAGARKWADDMCIRYEVIIRALLTDIVASIPFALGRIDPNGQRVGGQERKAMAGMFLLWPLGIVKRSPCASDEQLERAGTALQHIGTEMGVRRAVTLNAMWNVGSR